MEVTKEGMERLAVAQTIYKVIAAEVATLGKGGTGIRAQADKAVVDLWEQTGSKSIDIEVLGVKVGSISVKVETVPDYEDDGRPELEEFLINHGMAKRTRVLDEQMLTRNQRDHLIALAAAMNPMAVRDEVERDKRWLKEISPTPDGYAVWNESGELVPGIRVQTLATGTTLRVDEKKVAPLLGRVRKTVAAITGVAEDDADPEYETVVEAEYLTDGTVAVETIKEETNE